MARLKAIITGRLLAFDTSPLIYYIEQHPLYLPVADDLFDSIQQGNTRAVTSVLTLLEVLVHPLRRGLIDLVALPSDIDRIGGD